MTESKVGLCTYAAAGASPRAGIVVEGRVYDAQELLGPGHAGSSRLSTLQLLEDWKSALAAIRAGAAKISSGAWHGLPVAQGAFEVPVMYPGTLYCAGANYRDHIAEMARAAGDAKPMDPRMQGNMPWHFIRPARSCVVADKARIERPAGCLKLDWEVELAVVIGETARHVPLDRALDHVAGYAIAIDLSARDLSRRPLVDRNSPFYYDWLAHKGFEGSCPFGPYITLAGAIEDPQALPIRLSVNGEVRQDSNTSEMIFSVAEQLSHISKFVTLHPGDVILTGTPAGVGAASGTFLQPGDVLTASVGELGSLSATIT